MFTALPTFSNVHRLQSIMTRPSVIRDLFNKLTVWFEVMVNQFSLPRLFRWATSRVPPIIAVSATFPHFHVLFNLQPETAGQGPPVYRQDLQCVGTSLGACRIQHRSVEILNQSHEASHLLSQLPSTPTRNQHGRYARIFLQAQEGYETPNYREET